MAARRLAGFHPPRQVVGFVLKVKNPQTGEFIMSSGGHVPVARRRCARTQPWHFGQGWRVLVTSYTRGVPVPERTRLQCTRTVCSVRVLSMKLLVTGVPCHSLVPRLHSIAEVWARWRWRVRVRCVLPENSGLVPRLLHCGGVGVFAFVVCCLRTANLMRKRMHTAQGGCVLPVTVVLPVTAAIFAVPSV